MAVELDIQQASHAKNLPSDQQLYIWADQALSSFSKPEKPFELTIRLVDLDESQQLNNQYRNKNKPTNVLSFPFEIPEGVDINLLGDIIICCDIVTKEANEQQKDLMSHWAHMVIHGCLHLLGYDHIEDNDAVEMESIEIDMLEKLGINNPYTE